MRQRLAAFMQGRYGNDAFSRFILILACIFCFASMLLGLRAAYWIGLLLLAYSWFRILSRNIAARAAENRKYTAAAAKVKYWFSSKKYTAGQRKIYRIYKCPGCKQKIRIPKGHGRVEIRCPKCGVKFIKKS